MSMALFYSALTRQELEDILAGKIDFDDIQDQDRADLDMYSLEIYDDVVENGSDLDTLIYQSSQTTELDDKTYGGRLMDEDDIDAILNMFKRVDLKKYARKMGYPEEDNEEISNSLYKTLINLQKFFEKAKANGKIIINRMA